MVILVIIITPLVPLICLSRLTNHGPVQDLCPALDDENFDTRSAGGLGVFIGGPWEGSAFVGFPSNHS